MYFSFFQNCLIYSIINMIKSQALEGVGVSCNWVINLQFCAAFNMLKLKFTHVDSDHMMI